MHLINTHHVSPKASTRMGSAENWDKCRDLTEISRHSAILSSKLWDIKKPLGSQITRLTMPSWSFWRSISPGLSLNYAPYWHVFSDLSFPCPGSQSQLWKTLVHGGWGVQTRALKNRFILPNKRKQLSYLSIPITNSSVSLLRCSSCNCDNQPFGPPPFQSNSKKHSSKFSIRRQSCRHSMIPVPSCLISLHLALGKFTLS